MKYLLFLLLFSSLPLSAQQTVDTVRLQGGKFYSLRYISTVSADSMSKSEMFQRGIRPGDLNGGTFRRMDSIVVFNAAGERQAQDEKAGYRNPHSQLASNLPPAPPVKLFTPNTYFSGRIGESKSHEFNITNDANNEKILRVIEGGENVEFSVDEFRLAPNSKGTFQAKSIMPAGSRSEKVEWRDTDGENELELTFVWLGYDLIETDFIPSRERARLKPWLVPEGRETLYLRLQSTEKLMTIYKDGRPFKKVAVGRQLDEISLLALPKGDFMLEVIDLGSGKKRYHALRR